MGKPHNWYGFGIIFIIIFLGIAVTIPESFAQPPVGTIITPVDGTFYDAGDTILFSGSASDIEDGTLPASAYEWTVNLHHLQHIHPFNQFSGVTSGSFTIPTIGEVPPDGFFRITLTVTDSEGLMHTLFHDILPNTSTITLDTNPTGLQLKLDFTSITTPHIFESTVGHSRSLDAPLSQILNGDTYDFDSWSDGGAAFHAISTPATDTTFTATYILGIGNPPGTSEIIVHTVDSSGEIFGYFTVLSQGGVIQDTSFSAATFTVNNGETYNVEVQDFGDFKFVKWQDTGSTINNRDFAVSSNTEYFAEFSNITDPSPTPGTSKLVVRTVTSSGEEFTGHWTVLLQGGAIVQTGFSPEGFIVNNGETYEILEGDFAGITFDQWEDGSAVNPRTFSLTSGSTFTASFNGASPDSDGDGIEDSSDPLPNIPNALCDNKIGDWNDPASWWTQTVPTSSQRVYLQNCTLTVQSGQNVIADNIVDVDSTSTLLIDGDMTVNDILNLAGFIHVSSNTLDISGSFNIQSEGFLNNTATGVTNIKTGGNVNVQSGGFANNKGTYNVESGGTHNNNAGGITKIKAGGTFNVQSGGTVNDAGSHVTNTGSTTKVFGEWNQQAGAINAVFGTFSVESGGVYDNEANALTKIKNVGTFEVKSGGTLNNVGTYVTDAGGATKVFGEWNEQAGTINAVFGTFSVESGGIYDNEANALTKIKPGGNFNLQFGGKVNNFGNFITQGGGTATVDDDFDNNSGAVTNNSGTMTLACTNGAFNDLGGIFRGTPIVDPC